MLLGPVFIGECKLKVKNDGVGELLNKLRHLDTTEHANERMRGFIFDAEECWLIEAMTLKCVKYKRVPWTAGGSLKEIRKFFQWKQDWHSIPSMCQELKVEIVQGEPYLGMGARGRVFRVRKTDGHPDDHHALKVVQAKDKWCVEKEHARLMQEAKMPLAGSSNITALWHRWFVWIHNAANRTECAVALEAPTHP